MSRSLLPNSNRRVGFPEPTYLLRPCHGGTASCPLYYTSPGRAARFVFLADEQKAVEYLGTDIVDKNIRMISLYTPLHVTDFSEFTSSHAEFLLYADDPGPGFDWL